jgi:uncharacterized protein (TIGR02466 family)
MYIDDFFPTPVSETMLHRTLNEHELICFSKERKNSKRNYGNFISINQFVLERTELQDLKQIIVDKLNDYFNKVFEPETRVELYITNSWVNWSESEEFHHQHTHPNSIISGVLYIDTEEDDSITFYNPNNFLGNLKIKSRGTGKWTSDNWKCPVKKESLLIFPSTLKHGVEPRPNTSKKTRVSLSFNTWFRGTIGNPNTSDGLTIK